MTTKLKLQTKKDGSFTADDGRRIEYFWYKGLREGDDVTLEFGSKNEYEIGDEVELVLEKNEYFVKNKKGESVAKFKYKELSA